MWIEENFYGVKYFKFYWQDMGGGKNICFNSYYLKDVFFFCLKNLILGYMLFWVWIEKVNIFKVCIYFFGDNLLILILYKGFDFECNGDGRDVIYL